MTPRPHGPSLSQLVVATAIIAGCVAVVAAIDEATRRFTCDPSGIKAVRRAIDGAPAYTYLVQLGRGEHTPQSIDALPMAVEGTYAGPAQIHERYVDGIATRRYVEAIRLHAQRWVKFDDSRFPDETEWRTVEALIRDRVSDPRLVTLPENPARFAVDGLVPEPPDYEWTATRMSGAQCMLVGERVYSAGNDARQVLSVEVDSSTALPMRIVNRAMGFGTDESGLSRDWVISHAIRYPDDVASIERPDKVEPLRTIDWGGPTPTTPPPLRPPATFVLDGVQVDVSEFSEATEYEGITALPGNVFIHAFVRAERVDDTGDRGFIAGSYFEGWIEGVSSRLIGRVRPLPGGPQPAFARSTMQFDVGDVVMGWLSMEVPADSAAYLFRNWRPWDWEQSGVAILVRDP